MKFSRAIVRSPGTNFSDGISTSTAGRADYDQAMVQHTAYCQALESCGLDLVRLEADLRFPDSTFVEDAAVLVHEFAIVTNPGAKSRNGEKELIRPVLKSLFEKVYSIEPPGTLDGGDICQVDNHFLIGLSERTNIEGGKQLSEQLKEHGYSSDFVDCSKFPGLLHLKSGIAYLGEGIMVVSVMSRTTHLSTASSWSKYFLMRRMQLIVYVSMIMFSSQLDSPNLGLNCPNSDTRRCRSRLASSKKWTVV